MKKSNKVLGAIIAIIYVAVGGGLADFYVIAI